MENPAGWVAVSAVSHLPTAFAVNLHYNPRDAAGRGIDTILTDTWSFCCAFVRIPTLCFLRKLLDRRHIRGFADRGLNTWLPRQIMLPEPIHRLCP
jgi:hypothetical protein